MEVLYTSTIINIEARFLFRCEWWMQCVVHSASVSLGIAGFRYYVHIYTHRARLLEKPSRVPRTLGCPPFFHLSRTQLYLQDSSSGLCQVVPSYGWEYVGRYLEHSTLRAPSHLYASYPCTKRCDLPDYTDHDNDNRVRENTKIAIFRPRVPTLQLQSVS